MTSRDLGAAPTVFGVLERAAANGWRLVRFPDGRPVGPLEFRWREWARTASLLDRILAWEALPEPERPRAPLVQSSRSVAPPSAPPPPTRRAASPLALDDRLLWAPYEELAVPATPEEFVAAAQAVQHAPRCGLKLPEFRVAWFAPRAQDEWAERSRGVTFHMMRPVRVYLRSGLALTQLFRTTLHELQHVADAAYPDLSPAEREDRAERFVVDAMARWPRGATP